MPGNYDRKRLLEGAIFLSRSAAYALASATRRVESKFPYEHAARSAPGLGKKYWKNIG